jgi:hypothetical protein
VNCLHAYQDVGGSARGFDSAPLIGAQPRSCRGAHASVATSRAKGLEFDAGLGQAF